MVIPMFHQGQEKWVPHDKHEHVCHLELLDDGMSVSVRMWSELSAPIWGSPNFRTQMLWKEIPGLSLVEVVEDQGSDTYNLRVKKEIIQEVRKLMKLNGWGWKVGDVEIKKHIFNDPFSPTSTITFFFYFETGMTVSPDLTYILIQQAEKVLEGLYRFRVSSEDEKHPKTTRHVCGDNCPALQHYLRHHTPEEDLSEFTD